LENIENYRQKKKWFNFTVDESFYMALVIKNIPTKILQFDEKFFNDYSVETKQYLIYVIYILSNHFNSNILLAIINKYTNPLNYKNKNTNIDTEIDPNIITNSDEIKSKNILSKKIAFCKRIFDNFGKMFCFTIDDVNDPEKEKIMIRCFLMLHDQMCILKTKQRL